MNCFAILIIKDNYSVCLTNIFKNMVDSLVIFHNFDIINQKYYENKKNF